MIYVNTLHDMDFQSCCLKSSEDSFFLFQFYILVSVSSKDVVMPSIYFCAHIFIQIFIYTIDNLGSYHLQRACP